MKLRNIPFPTKGMEDRHVMFVIEYLKTFKTTVAAEACGYPPEYGHKLIQRPDVELAVSLALRNRYEEACIDAGWVLQELVDNHFLARQSGNLAASNQALNTIAKHAQVDAFAAEKFELAGDEDKVAKLLRGRKRVKERDAGKPENSTTEKPSFM